MYLISKNAFRNLLAIGGFLALSTAYVVQDGHSSSSGITGVTEKPNAGNGVGCYCHSDDASTETVVNITTTATSFLPGQTYTFKVTMSNPAQLAGGLSIAKFLAGASDTSSSFKVIAGQGLKRPSITHLTHISPKEFVDGSTSWEFEYVAPPINKPFDTIYVTGNAVNLDGDDRDGEAEDFWAHAPKFVVALNTNAVSPRNDIAEAFAIGPNPARNVARLYFTMKKPADLRIAVLDAAGREVYVQNRSEQSFGRGEVMLDLTELTAGDYLVNVTSGGSLCCVF